MFHALETVSIDTSSRQGVTLLFILIHAFGYLNVKPTVHSPCSSVSIKLSSSSESEEFGSKTQNSELKQA